MLNYNIVVKRQRSSYSSNKIKWTVHRSPERCCPLSKHSQTSWRSECISTWASLASDSVSYNLQAVTNDAQCHVGCSTRYDTEMLTATAHLPNRNRLRSSASTRYELPALRRKIGECAFSYSGPASWNSLPSDITSIMDTPTFRVRLKTHLFRLAFRLVTCL